MPPRVAVLYRLLGEGPLMGEAEELVLDPRWLSKVEHAESGCWLSVARAIIRGEKP